MREGKMRFLGDLASVAITHGHCFQCGHQAIPISCFGRESLKASDLAPANPPRERIPMGAGLIDLEDVVHIPYVIEVSCEYFVVGQDNL